MDDATITATELSELMVSDTDETVAAHIKEVAFECTPATSGTRAAQQQLIGMQSENHRLNEEVELLKANRIQTAMQRRTITAGALQAGAINNALTQEHANMISTG